MRSQDRDYTESLALRVLLLKTADEVLKTLCHYTYSSFVFMGHRV